jgi:hypothetical protein
VTVPVKLGLFLGASALNALCKPEVLAMVSEPSAIDAVSVKSAEPSKATEPETTPDSVMVRSAGQIEGPLPAPMSAAMASMRVLTCAVMNERKSLSRTLAQSFSPDPVRRVTYWRSVGSSMKSTPPRLRVFKLMVVSFTQEETP